MIRQAYENLTTRLLILQLVVPETKFLKNGCLDSFLVCWHYRYVFHYFGACIFDKKLRIGTSTDSSLKSSDFQKSVSYKFLTSF